MSKTDLSQLKPAELRAMVVLMVEARALTNRQLRELAGTDLTGQAGPRLTAFGLVSVEKVGLANQYTLTDRGWQALREPYASEPLGAVGRFALTLLTALQHALDRRGVSHGEFFQPAPQPAVARRPTKPTSAKVKKRIRAAYAKLPKAPAGWVGLADLRDQLTDLSREEVDGALVEMARDDDVRLTPVANTRSLHQRDRDAAVHIGDDLRHMIAIG